MQGQQNLQLPAPTLFRECCRLIRMSRLYSFAVVFFVVAAISMQMLTDYLYISMVDDDTQGRALLFATFTLGDRMNDFLRETFLVFLVIKLQCAFYQNGFSLYHLVLSKLPGMTIRIHNDILTSAGSSINQVMEWGLSSTCFMVGNLLSTIMSLIIFDFTIVDLIVIPVGVFTTCVVVRTFQKRLILVQQRMRTEQEAIKALEQLMESLFSRGFLSVSKMTEFFSKSVISQMSVRFGYVEVGRSLDVCMAVITLIYAYYLPNDRLFLAKYAIIRKIASAISCIVNFNSSYQSFSEEYNVYFKKLTELLSPSKNTVEYTTHESFEIPLSGFLIRDINIKVSPKYSITGQNEIQIRPGDQILLKGEAGIGKSSLMKAIANQIEGITLLKNKMGNYSSSIFLPASIFDGIPFGLLSISHVFLTTNHDDFILIISFMKLLYGCNYNKLSHKLLPFDKLIGELSAGERQILFLVWTLYQIEKRKYKMLLLDEPEQNLDETTKSDVMMALYKYLSEHKVATIWCTHTDDDQMRALKRKGMVFTGGSIQIVKENEMTASVLFTKP
jgi:ABC-type iron transport system FetAB ATPase subunit